MSKPVEQIAETLHACTVEVGSNSEKLFAVDFDPEVVENCRDGIDAAGYVDIANQVERSQSGDDSFIVPGSVLRSTTPSQTDFMSLRNET
jgi:hypothetical protein